MTTNDDEDDERDELIPIDMRIKLSRRLAFDPRWIWKSCRSAAI